MDAKIIEFDKENKTMRMFTAIGIILIVAGHLNEGIFTFGGLFPYYAFHVFIFLFVSGYFVSPRAELKAFLIRKIRRLLLPYFVFNLLYGILSTVLNGHEIYVGQGISVYNLLIAPFLGGHQFMFNSPAWFVPALFITELIYMLSMQILNIILKSIEEGKRQTITDLLLLGVYLLLGIITVYLAIGGHVWGFYKTIGRWLLMLPFIALGRVYKAYIQPFIRALLEKYADTVAKKTMFFVLYFALLILGQICLVNNTAGLNISVVWCTSFGNGPVIPFVAACSGMAFWYGIASIMGQIQYFKPLLVVGRHSYSVMTHHLFILFIINTIFGLCFGANGFDLSAYRTDIFYQYMYLGEAVTPFINMVVCVTVPVILGVLWRKSPLCDKI